MPPTLTPPKELKTLELGPQFRAYKLDRDAIDEEARTVELAFSSEEPYERWWGTEILDHETQSIRLGRLLDGGAVLLEHSPSKHIGVVERAWVDDDQVARAVVRFSRSALGEEAFRDVIDGIKPHVSVGYRIHRAVLEESSDDGDIYRITDWEPFEVSFVAIPADPTVGVGRSAGNEPKNHVQIETRSNNMPPEDPTPGGQAVADPPAPPASPPVDARVHELAGAENENRRVTEILELGRMHNAADDAMKFVTEKKSVEDFKDHLLKRQDFRPLRETDGDLGLSDKEKRSYNLMRAIRAMADPSNRAAQEAAGFEFECSEQFAKQENREAKGLLIPPDILKMQRSLQQRDLNTGTDSQGGYLVDTELRPQNFIELLRNASAVMPYATILNGLVGDLAIPRQSGTVTTAWVAEGGATAESQLALGLLSLAPKTVTATTDITRKMLIQSSLDIQNLVLQDLAAAIGLAIDYAAVNGSGAANQPQGILNMSGIGSHALGANGAAPDWDMLVDLETEVATDNALMGTPRYLGSAKVRGKLKRVEKATYGDTMLMESNGMANGYEYVMSNQVPDDLDKGTSVGVCSALIFGYLATVHIGLWSGLDVLVDPYSQSRAGTIQVTAHQDADVAARHEEALSACVDILTT